MKQPVRKLAFIHYAKAAGRFINYYLPNQVFNSKSSIQAEQECKTFNSWNVPYLLERDWTEEELLQLARNRHPLQCPSPKQIVAHYQRHSHDYLSRQYVHNHHDSWSASTVRAFRQNGWFTFMFLREPAELLCSLWTWTQNNLAVNPLFMSGTIQEPLTPLELDDFLRAMIATPALHPCYALPDYIDEIEYVAEFTDENFRCFLQERFNHQYCPESVSVDKRFTSGNPGYAAYRQQGRISDATHSLLNNDLDVQRVRDLLLSNDR